MTSKKETEREIRRKRNLIELTTHTLELLRDPIVEGRFDEQNVLSYVEAQMKVLTQYEKECVKTILYQVIDLVHKR